MTESDGMRGVREKISKGEVGRNGPEKDMTD